MDLEDVDVVAEEEEEVGEVSIQEILQGTDFSTVSRLIQTRFLSDFESKATDLHKVQGFLLDAANALSQVELKEDQREAKAEELEQSLKKIIQTREKFAAQSKIFEELSSQLNSPNFSISDFLNLKQNQRANTTLSPALEKDLEKATKQLRKSMGVRREAEDEDLEIMNEGEENLIDPVTKKMMERPLRASCNHAFSRESIYSLFQNQFKSQTRSLNTSADPNVNVSKNKALANLEVRCPVAGCSRNVVFGELKHDPILELKITQADKRKKLGLDQKEEEAGDEEEIDFTQSTQRSQ